MKGVAMQFEDLEIGNVVLGLRQIFITKNQHS